MIFVITYIVCIPTGTSSALKKKKSKESQYTVSHPETDSDPPIGSDWELGRDTAHHKGCFRRKPGCGFSFIMYTCIKILKF